MILAIVALVLAVVAGIVCATLAADRDSGGTGMFVTRAVMFGAIVFVTIAALFSRH